MKELPSWMWRDPSKVYERIEEMEQRQVQKEHDTKQKKATEELKKLFEESPDE